MCVYLSHRLEQDIEAFIVDEPAGSEDDSRTELLPEGAGRGRGRFALVRLRVDPVGNDLNSGEVGRELGRGLRISLRGGDDALRTLQAALRRVLKPAAINTIALRRQIADAAVERKGYPF